MPRDTRANLPGNRIRPRSLGLIMEQGSNLQIEVACHAGYRADEHPVRFYLNGRPVLIVAELSRWVEPRGRYFKVLGDDGRRYVLLHETAGDTWLCPAMA